MATVSDISGICLIALMTPPHNITLYSTENIINHQAIKCLIDGLEEYNIPGVTTEKELANIFAKEYTAQKGLSFKTTMSQRIYELTAVNPDIQQFGVVRLLEEKDMHFFPYWLEAFNAAAVYGNTEMSIPFSLAGFTREMQTAIGVAFVYTPPYYRGKGYASSCVAQLSQIALDKEPVFDSLMLKYE